MSVGPIIKIVAQTVVSEKAKEWAGKKTGELVDVATKKVPEIFKKLKK